eukprot:m.347085 g.347085  ORF g.347085 m.347085 type:complete len:2908 (+) comp20667_c0_seq20:342-9065(+)
MAVASWIHRFDALDDPKMRLFCIPHAGGGPHAFRSWSASDGLDNIEVACISPPGRSLRHGEPFHTDMAVMVPQIVDAMVMFFDMPYAILGHSMGSLVGYEVICEISRRGLPPPLLFVASSECAPHALRSDTVGHVDMASLRGLSDAEFVEKVGSEWGFMQLADIADAATLSLVLPPLRADLDLMDAYAMAQQNTSKHIRPLPCPMIAFGGEDDHSVSMDMLRTWKDCCQNDQNFHAHLFSGGHFYMENHRKPVLAYLQKSLEDILHQSPLAVMLGDQPCHPEFAQCLHSLFEASAARHGPKTAVVGLRRTLTYAQLDHESTLLARFLQHVGVKKGDHVGIYLPHSEEYIIGNLAIYKAGAAMFLLETNYTSDMISDLIIAGDVRFVLTNSELGVKLPAHTRFAVDAPVVAAQQRLGAILLDDVTMAQTLEQRPDGLPTLQQYKQDPVTDVAYLTMTSGSTGKPKAVVNTHFGAVLCFYSRNDIYPYQDNEREGLNVFFAWEALRAILFGSTAVVIPDDVIFDPRRLLHFIQEQQITRLMVTPSLMNTILMTPRLDFAALMQHMVLWWLEGEVTPMQLANKFARVVAPSTVQLINVYASWEALDNTYGNLSDPRDYALNNVSKFASVGRCMPHVQVYICDDKMQLKHQEQPGDVYIGTPAMFLGYMGDEKKTKDRLMDNPWAPHQADPQLGGPTYRHSDKMYRTGDRGRVRSDGQLEILGRSDFTVKIRAFKVALGMVEQTIAELDGVKQVAVTAKLSAATNQPEDLVAYVVLLRAADENRTPDQEDVRPLYEALKTLLPDYAVPAYWVPMEKLPQKGGESRKLDRTALVPPTRAHRMTSRRPAGNEAATVSQGAGAGALPTAGSTQTAAPTGAVVDALLQAFRETLNIEDLLPSDNFFELGGHSLLAATLVGEISNLGYTIAITDLYQHPSVEALATAVLGVSANPLQSTVVAPPTRARGTGWHEPVAIVGVAGEFPGAPDIHALWRNLLAGTDAVTKISPAEYETRGVSRNVWEHPQWVPAAYAIGNADKFDAAFFGITPREAKVMDPQHRRFLQCAWAAVESAGYAPKSGTPSRTAVFAACGIDGYMHHHLDGTPLKDMADPAQVFLGEVASEKDYIATRVSYALNLSGPSMTVNSACSSGLVAVAQAAAALQAGHCDMAIAGAASVSFPNLGYMYGDGLVGSVDGRVRPFDTNASGTVFGDSVGAVVLKRLSDAEADGDFVWSVISGAAVTNDGSMKAAYTAPSASAQARAIAEAQRQARVDPIDVTYVECHATATLLGDGIELSGLSDAFNANVVDAVTGDTKAVAAAATGNVPLTPAQSCSTSPDCPQQPTVALGSIKGNIGHANCAAGITGLIKTMLCMRHQTLVPTVHYTEANPKLQLDSPRNKFFYVNTDTKPWVLPVGVPRRIAGVSSFGIGGTNCHLVLEEHRAGANRETTDATSTCPLVQAAARARKSLPTFGQHHLLTFSAKSISALRASMEQLRAYLLARGDGVVHDYGKIADVMQRGREAFQYRATVVVCEAEPVTVAMEAIQTKLNALDDDMTRALKDPRVVLMFPGQGSQYLRMGKQLYQDVPVFAQHMDECVGVVRELLGVDIRAELFVEAGLEAQSTFSDARIVQSSLFATEYSVAQTLLHCGVKPSTLAGHSIGEYVAAVVGGVLSVTAALRMIIIRATAAKEDCLPGGMMSVTMTQTDVDAFVQEFNASVVSVPGTTSPTSGTDTISVAAYNNPTHAVLAGSTAALDTAHQLLLARRDAHTMKIRPLHVTNAFHSPLMAPAAAKVQAFVDGVPPNDRPKLGTIPVTSNVTGTWMNADVSTGAYWSQHITGPVRWVQNVETILERNPSVFVEVGPGTTLSYFVSSTLARRQAASPSQPSNVPGTSDTPPHARTSPAPAVVSTMRHVRNTDDNDVGVLLAAVGSMWERGVAVDWRLLHHNRPVARVPDLPTYAWDPVSHWTRPERSIHVAPSGTAPTNAPPTVHKVDDYAHWLVRYAKVNREPPSARDVPVILFCFTFAGGSTRAFEPWACSRTCPRWVDVVGVEAFGRGTRADEEHRRDKAEETAIVAALIRAELDKRPEAQFALCGLSMGVLMAIEIGLQLQGSEYSTRLVSLAIAGRPMPVVGETPQYDLDELNLAPKACLQSAEWENYFKPMLTADLEDDSKSSHRVAQLLANLSEEQRFTCDLLVFYGTKDTSFNEPNAEAWARVLQSSVSSHELPATPPTTPPATPSATPSVTLTPPSSTAAMTITCFSEGHDFIVKESLAVFDTILGSLVRTQQSSRDTLAAVQWVSHRAPRSEASLNAAIDALMEQQTHYVLRTLVPIDDGCNSGDARVNNNQLTETPLPLSFPLVLSNELTSALDSDVGLVIAVGLFPLGGVDDVARERNECWAFLQLVQTVVATNRAARLVLMCPVGIAGAMTMGASKAAALEHPDLSIQRVFYTPSGAGVGTEGGAGGYPLLTSDVWRVLHAVREGRGEPDVLLQDTRSRTGARKKTSLLVPRAVPVAPIHAGSSPSSVPPPGVLQSDEHKTYVVSGGTGGVGRAVVQWLLEHNRVPAHNVVVLCRRASSDRARALAERGVRVVEVDCADAVAMATCADLAALTNVAGVFHLAGVLEDGLISNVTPEALASVVKPKVVGAFALLQLATALAWELDFLVNFSSTSSLMGYAGQASYCAANSVLDHLATWGPGSIVDAGCTSLPVEFPVLAVNWGPWAEAGMAAPGTKAYVQSLRDGDYPLSNACALEQLGRVLGRLDMLPRAPRQYVVCDVDWAVSPWMHQPLVHDWRQATDSARHAHAAHSNRTTATAPPSRVAPGTVAADVIATTTDSPGDHDAAVEELLRGIVPVWEPSSTLTGAGLDSLDIVQMRNIIAKDLGIKLPLSLYNQPNITIAGLMDVLRKNRQNMLTA